MNHRRRQILHTLANSVRALTISQIACTWWTDTSWGRKRASAAMNQLATEGWLHVQRAVSRPVELFATPMIDWRPGDQRPDFKATARSLHRRAMVDAKSATIVFASSRAVNLFGAGRAPIVKLTQLTHDLNVTELYLHFRRNGLPDRHWISEDRLPHGWPLKERPDALLRNEAGEIVRAIEYGGDYPVSRLAELHAGLSRIGLRYEIW